MSSSRTEKRFFSRSLHAGMWRGYQLNTLYAQQFENCLTSDLSFSHESTVHVKREHLSVETDYMVPTNSVIVSKLGPTYCHIHGHQDLLQRNCAVEPVYQADSVFGDFVHNCWLTSLTKSSTGSKKMMWLSSYLLIAWCSFLYMGCKYFVLTISSQAKYTKWARVGIIQWLPV